MKKILLCIIFLTACITLNAQRFRSSSPARRYYYNYYHEDTDRITFSVNGRPMYFTYHYCDGMYAGKLFTTKKNGKVQIIRSHIILATDPAEMDPEELRRFLWNY